MILTSYKREYYILAGKVGMLELLEEKGIRTSPLDLLIIPENSKLGKLIKKEVIDRVEQIKNKIKG